MPATRQALIVIDLQTGLMDGAWFPPLHEHEQLLEKTRALIAWARAAGRPVAFVQHDGEPGEWLERGKGGWPLHPALEPAPGEPIFSKDVGDAFSNPALGAWLADNGADGVILLGAASNQCVNDTVNGAIARGIDVSVVKDAHSTSPWGAFTAPQIIDHYNKLFAEAGATLVETADLTRA